MNKKWHSLKEICANVIKRLSLANNTTWGIFHCIHLSLVWRNFIEIIDLDDTIVIKYNGSDYTNVKFNILQAFKYFTLFNFVALAFATPFNQNFVSVKVSNFFIFFVTPHSNVQTSNRIKWKRHKNNFLLLLHFLSFTHAIPLEYTHFFVHAFLLILL